MRTLNWLWRGFLFFVLFAFALNNRHEVDLHWFWGYHWQAPMVIVVLAVFAMGCVSWVLAMLPSWWRHRRDAKQRLQWLPDSVSPPDVARPVAARSGPITLPAELPFPPDMPAPRKPAK
ncbi:MAG: LapA family protein [Burkholderiales bacterium]|nr:LapA family protein [Burkholderiales bacterium]